MSHGTYEQACKGKRWFESRGLAKAMIRRLQSNPMFKPCPGWTLIPYRCDYCGRWHVGNERTDALPVVRDRCRN